MTKFIVLTKWKNEVAVYSSGKDLEKQICKYGGYLEFVFSNDKLNIPITCLVSYFQFTVRCMLGVKENWNRNINFRVIRVYMIIKTMRLNEIHKDISATITQTSKSSLQHSTVQRSERSKQYDQDSICINITLCMFMCIFFFSKLYIPNFKFLNCCEKMAVKDV